MSTVGHIMLWPNQIALPFYGRLKLAFKQCLSLNTAVFPNLETKSASQYGFGLTFQQCLL
jgi:hypothetical protein